MGDYNSLLRYNGILRSKEAVLLHKLQVRKLPIEIISTALRNYSILKAARAFHLSLETQAYGLPDGGLSILKDQLISWEALWSAVIPLIFPVQPASDLKDIGCRLIGRFVWLKFLIVSPLTLLRIILARFMV
jgi:hypothetical protein